MAEITVAWIAIYAMSRRRESWRRRSYLLELALMHNHGAKVSLTPKPF